MVDSQVSIEYTLYTCVVYSGYHFGRLHKRDDPQNSFVVPITKMSKINVEEK